MDSQSVGGDPCKLAMPKRFPITRRGFGTKGKDIMLLTNHFKVSVNRTDEFFFHYYVNMKYEDDQPVDKKGIGRKVISKLRETYASELANKEVAYDGEKSLFTIGALPQTNNLFKIVLEDFSSGKTGTSRSPGGNGSPGASDKKRMKRSMQAKTFKVEINFATKIPMSAIAQVLRGQESENSQEALRVFDIILRQHSAKQGCLLVRQSFFHNKPSNFIDLGGGVMGCRGFHTSFRPTQSGLSLNIDISTTMIVRPGPVIDFLLYNQHVDHPRRIDWGKAKRALKNLRIKTTHTNSEFRIIGLSENTCYDQTFPLNQRDGNDSGTVEVTVYDYFRKHWCINLKYSAYLPCLNVGKPKRPTYVLLELCHLVPLQRYTKSLSTLQRSSLVEKSRQKPGDRMSTLSEALRNSDYDSELMLRGCGISIAREFTQVNGRVLEAPKLKAAGGEDLFARNGKWNFNKKRLIQTSKVKSWGAVNFSTPCNVRDFVRRLIHTGSIKGIHMDQEDAVIEERPEMIGEPPARRVDDMFDQIMSKFPEEPPSFLLCFLPERKNCDIYGPWKLMRTSLSLIQPHMHRWLIYKVP